MSIDTKTINATITEQNNKFCQHYNSGNAQALVEQYFVPDKHQPKACPPGGTPPIVGVTSLIAMFQNMMQDAPQIRLESIDLITSKTMAFELGRAFLTLTDGSTALGRYTVAWLLIDGAWKASIDFFADDGWKDQ